MIHLLFGYSSEIACCLSAGDIRPVAITKCWHTLKHVGRAVFNLFKSRWAIINKTPPDITLGHLLSAAIPDVSSVPAAARAFLAARLNLAARAISAYLPPRITRITTAGCTARAAWCRRAGGDRRRGGFSRVRRRRARLRRLWEVIHPMRPARPEPARSCSNRAGRPADSNIICVRLLRGIDRGR